MHRLNTSLNERCIINIILLLINSGYYLNEGIMKVIAFFTWMRNNLRCTK